ncbi:GPW/gp25 family protein [Spartinivicinus poritis]|uniref:GPW/gp25 family protein n=1 Tax=Spartinivicinus poritis TaxID=2994640 RepID=A0ABT5UHG7_9GAMM|nr:GPW/gp25 family protein [Spartinivicinus sp. A2-2]MDE1465803.1 GPW/gp25 family protein [Spartinivicinus sp. A2-2]
MKGTHRQTGKPLSNLDHLRQSITDILTTRIGTRLMRRDYGSRLPELVDCPMNGQWLVEIYAATAEALIRWEPRIKVNKVQAYRGEPGELLIVLEGIYLPEGKPITLDGIIV